MDVEPGFIDKILYMVIRLWELIWDYKDNFKSQIFFIVQFIILQNSDYKDDNKEDK